MKKVQHESAGPFVIALSTEEGSRTQSGREREGRQSGGLPGSERSEAGREGGEEEARRRGALRAVAPTISTILWKKESLGLFFSLELEFQQIVEISMFDLALMI